MNPLLKNVAFLVQKIKKSIGKQRSYFFNAVLMFFSRIRTINNILNQPENPQYFTSSYLEYPDSIDGDQRFIGTLSNIYDGTIFSTKLHRRCLIGSQIRL